MDKPVKILTSAEITPAMITEWKAKFGEVHIVEVAVDPLDPEALMDSIDFDGDETDIKGEKLIGYLRKPNNNIRNMAYSYLASSGFVEAAKEMLKACWLGGDQEILTDKAKLHFAATQIASWIQVYQAKLKKA